MHPAISAWPSLFFYQGKLKDGTSALAGAVASRAADFHRKSCFAPLAFFDCRCDSSSFVHHAAHITLGVLAAAVAAASVCPAVAYRQELLGQKALADAPSSFTLVSTERC